MGPMSLGTQQWLFLAASRRPAELHARHRLQRLCKEPVSSGGTLLTLLVPPPSPTHFLTLALSWPGLSLPWRYSQLS